MEQAFFRARALAMAQAQARVLLDAAIRPPTAVAVDQACSLIRDCVRHLDQPALAIAFALDFHSVAERSAHWTAWGAALDLVLALDRRCQTRREMIRLLNCRSMTARGLGDYARATETATAALRLAERECDAELIAESHNRIGMIAFLQDDLHTARAHFEQAYGCGPPGMLGDVSMNLGTIAMHQGRFAESRRCFDEALDHYRVNDDPVATARAQCNLAELHRRMGEAERVLPSLLAACDVFQAAGARNDYGLAQNDLGCVYLSLGQWRPAAAALVAAVAEFEQIGSMSNKAFALSNLAELYVTTEQWALAEPALDEAHALAELCGRTIVAAAVDVDRGRMLAARSDYSSARRIWERALRSQEQSGAWLAAEQTRRLIEALPATDERLVMDQ